MLRAELLADPGVLVLTPEGSLTAADFARVRALAEPVIAREGRLAGVLVRARAFPGWAGFGAMLSHLRFVRDHHRKIARVAVATDAAVLSVLPAIAKHFVAAEIRRFGYDEKDQALAWLAEAGPRGGRPGMAR